MSQSYVYQLNAIVRAVTVALQFGNRCQYDFLLPLLASLAALKPNSFASKFSTFLPFIFEISIRTMSARLKCWCSSSHRGLSFVNLKIRCLRLICTILCVVDFLTLFFNVATFYVLLMDNRMDNDG